MESNFQRLSTFLILIVHVNEIYFIHQNEVSPNWKISVSHLCRYVYVLYGLLFLLYLPLTSELVCFPCQWLWGCRARCFNLRTIQAVWNQNIKQCAAQILRIVSVLGTDSKTDITMTWNSSTVLWLCFNVVLISSAEQIILSQNQVSTICKPLSYILSSLQQLSRGLIDATSVAISPEVCNLFSIQKGFVWSHNY